MITLWHLLLLPLVVVTGVLLVMMANLQQRLRRTVAHAMSMRGRWQRLMRNTQERIAAVQASHTEYWDLVQESQVALMVTRPRGEIVAINRSALQLFGYDSLEELRALGAGVLYADPSDRDTKTLHWLSKSDMVHNQELRILRKDGAVLEVLISLRIIRHPELGELFEGAVTDVTALRNAIVDNRRLEEQLLSAQRLEAIGELAAGIAHEINTPIQFVSDNTHFLRTALQELQALHDSYHDAAAGLGDTSLRFVGELDELDARAELPVLKKDILSALEGSLEGVERVSEIVRAMKEFAHPGSGELAATDINATLNTTLVVTRNAYKQVAGLEVRMGDIPLVVCRRADVNKVFLNMIINAAHAIESVVAKTGTLGTLRVQTAQRGQFVRVSISDTGCGIPQALIKRIFDPFFTTKAIGKGTGQGLAIAAAIIERHAGSIEVESVVNEGTTMHVDLPIGGPESVTRENQSGGIAA
ncbi:MAG: ATP-binding protein [Pseudomonadota bacterium]